MLVHVGLPKAASSYLQREVFPSWVISWEGWVGTGLKNFKDFDKRLKSLKEKYPRANILFITREIEDWKESIYSLYLRRGGQASREDFKKRYEGLSWQPFIDAYKKNFPKVYVLKFETLRDEPGKFKKQLEEILGESVELPEKKINVRLNKRQEIIAKFLNRYARPLAYKLGMPKKVRENLIPKNIMDINVEE